MLENTGSWSAGDVIYQKNRISRMLHNNRSYSADFIPEEPDDTTLNDAGSRWAGAFIPVDLYKYRSSSADVLLEEPDSHAVI